MANKDRTKEVWLIPKRCSLYQTACLIGAIIDRNYDGVVWSQSRQNDLGVNLSRMGATRSGRNISTQAMRTLAALPQYLGFLYIDGSSTPSRIRLTKAGEKLWEEQQHNINPTMTLSKNEREIVSDVTRLQLEKLLITNPIIGSDCENILLFPFRFTLAVLLKLGYLDITEIAMFILQCKGMDEVDFVCQEIKNYRELSSVKRKELVNTFEKTAIGNLTLVQAPSAQYFMKICCMSGLIKIMQIKPINCDIKLNSISIVTEQKRYVEDVVFNKYRDVDVFDFRNDLRLWIEYIGNPSRLRPPVLVEFINKDTKGYLFVIGNNRYSIKDGYIEKNSFFKFPLFLDEEYQIKLINPLTGLEVQHISFIPTKDKTSIAINSSDQNTAEENVNYLEKIEELISVNNLPEDIIRKIRGIKLSLGIDIPERNSNLRGAYLEYYFFRWLEQLVGKGIIDDVSWYGIVDKYGFPRPAPGGVMGKPDIVFTINQTQFVLEMTTIRPKALQFSAEGSSVPDHIRLFAQENTSKKTVGIFIAPTIHLRNTSSMQATIEPYEIKLNCLTISDFISVLNTLNREAIITTLS